DGFTTIQTPLEIVSSSENIPRATVGLRPGQDNAGLAVDDVEFERGHPAASLSPSPVQFSNSRVGAAAPPATVSLASVGSASLEVGSVTVGGSNAGDFSKMSDGCSGKSLQPRSSCSVQVQFRPTAE